MSRFAMIWEISWVFAKVFWPGVGRPLPAMLDLMFRLEVLSSLITFRFHIGHRPTRMVWEDCLGGEIAGVCDGVILYICTVVD